MTKVREKWFNSLKTEEKIIRLEIKKLKKDIRYQKTALYDLLLELAKIDKRKETCQYYDERAEIMLQKEVVKALNKIKKYKTLKKVLCYSVKRV